MTPRESADLPPDIVDLLDGKAPRRRYAAGEFIHSRGDAADGLWVVRSGAVRFSTLLADGREIELHVMGAGSVFGEVALLGGIARPHNATAVGETVLGHVSAARVERLLAARPEVARALVAQLARRLALAFEGLDDLRTLALPDLVLKRLRLAAADDGQVSMTQDALASLCGTSRVTMGKTLRALRDRGDIALSYGGVRLTAKGG